jgi:hypothetical protein
MKNKVGRPSKYSQELADIICSELMLGKSLRTVTQPEGMPSIVTIFAWMRIHPEFLNQYTRAKQESADAMAEDILYLADSTEQDKDAINKTRLQVDTRKFLMAKMKPKKYGDSSALDITTKGKELPAPILGGIAKDVRANDGHQEDSST